jgi:hypothetical protein
MAVRVSSLEIAAYGILIGLASFLVFGSHLRHGGFVSDDWGFAAGYRFAPHPQFLHLFEDTWKGLGDRPVSALVNSAVYAVLGTDPQPILVWGVALGALVSLTFFVLLRTAGLERLPAALVAALVLVFPWSDSTKLWPTASNNSIAVSCYLVGAVLSLRAFAATGRRATALHAGGLSLYAITLLTYEGVAAMIPVTGLLYLARAPAAAARRRWALDIGLTAVGVVYATTATTFHRGLADAVVRVPLVAYEGARIGLSALVPFGPFVQVVVLGAAVLAATLRLRLVPLGDADVRTLRRWLIVGAGAAGAAGAGLAGYLTSGLLPEDPGTLNRGNMVAALAFALFVYAVLRAFATLLTYRSGRWSGLGAALAAAGCLVVGGAYVRQVDRDASKWNAAAALNRRALGTLQRRFPRLPAGTTVYLFGHPAQLAPGVIAFGETWDLNGAVQLLYDSGRISAFPIMSGVDFECGRGALYPKATPSSIVREDGYGPRERSAYGKALFVDARSGSARWISSQAGCRAAARSFRPGGYLLCD